MVGRDNPGSHPGDHAIADAMFADRPQPARQPSADRTCAGADAPIDAYEYVKATVLNRYRAILISDIGDTCRRPHAARAHASVVLP
jgi:hypothetical protein